MEKEFNVALIVKVNVVLDDSEATEQTVRFLVEEDLCDKGWDADVALLKEQEAKQIVRKQCKKEHEDGSIDYFAEWYCPHCKQLLLRGFDNPSIKFCYKCGNPILWEMPVKWEVKWE